MAYVVSSGVKLFWEEEGSGEPILMIMGLSFTLDMWFRVRPALSKRYRLILFDNRGVGRSETPRGPYSIRQMAEDAVAVMNAAGVPSAYVMGASMGGMIAQELALRHPERVRALMLGCTSGGALGSKMAGSQPALHRHWSGEDLGRTGVADFAVALCRFDSEGADRGRHCGKDAFSAATQRFLKPVRCDPHLEFLPASVRNTSTHLGHAW